MLNRPTSQWTDELQSSEPGWDADHSPRLRLSLIWIAIVLPVLAVAARLGALQLSLQEGFASAFSIAHEEWEDIPARDGRVIAADGTVLADDVPEYDVAIHYQSVQDPPDDGWLTGKAKERLSKKDKKNKDRVAEEKQRVFAENELRWQRLADLTDRPLEELLESRQQIQKRVDRIKSTVERNFREKQQKRAMSASAAAETAQSSWSKTWANLREYLEESEERSTGPRLVAEEKRYHTVITGITADMKAELEAHQGLYPQLQIVVRTRRTYPLKEFASHVIGYRKPITTEQLAERRESHPDGDPLDYRLGDSYGLDGIERSYDTKLKGIRGQRKLIKNRRGEIIETIVVREPIHGTDVSLTIVSDLQRLSEELLAKALMATNEGTGDPESTHAGGRQVTCPQGGCIVAIDVHTGAVVAAASAPSFDLNLMVTPDAEAWNDLISDRRSPLISRITKYPLPPGSVFKPITAAAAVESGTMHPGEVIACRGYLDRPDQPHRCLIFIHNHVGHGDINMADALCRSCNVYFYTAARRMGPQTLVDWARRFGIGQTTGIDLPTESPGRLPSPDQLPSQGSPRPRWKPFDTLGLAIGQSTLEVTPLQMARMMAAIANDGYLVTPHFVGRSGPSSIEQGSQSETLPKPDAVAIPGLHSGTLDAIREGLVMVVHDPRGTGYKTVRMKELTIAGKTGTAQTNGVDHAWFAGYVPAERPRYAFAVVLQNGGGGGKVAGPVAHQFVEGMIDAGLISKATQVAEMRQRNRKSTSE